MKCLITLIPFALAVSVHAAEDDVGIYSPEIKKTFTAEQKATSSAINKKELEKTTKPQEAAAIRGGTADVIIVDPAVLAKDWVEAFSFLSGKKVTKINFVLKNGSMIGNVMEVQPLEGGYLMRFTSKTLQGTKYQIVKTGDIATLESS